ncbi:MAG: nucleotidyltransferase domain-containing protein [Bacteroidetes bacterium]|nr:nucleotidyltransferase domain-containing protein [Bacteroidota bacterium]
MRKLLIDAFSSQNEVYKICFFGREAEGKHDCYSDIDVLVFSNDLPKTKAIYKQVFSSISPIRSVIQLEAHPGGYSEMVQLVDYSPYQKVDFSILGEGMCNWNQYVVYQNQNKPINYHQKLEDIPITHDIGYLNKEIMFSVARFTKCLFRHDIDMYRRWTNISVTALALLYEKHFGWKLEIDKSSLGSSGTKRLYDDLESDERSFVEKIRPSDGKLDILLSYQSSIELIIELSRQKAQHFDIMLDCDFMEYIYSFMIVEMAKYRKQNYELY